MAFKDLDEFFDDSLRLPVGGREYVIAAPTAETGLWCQQIIERGADARRRAEAGEEPKEGDTLDDTAEKELYQRVLGPVYDEMIEVGLSWPKIKHVGYTAFFWCAGNKDTAEKYWESGGDPEALARLGTNRQQRRASGSPKKAGGAAAKSTKSRASTSGTKKRG